MIDLEVDGVKMRAPWWVARLTLIAVSLSMFAAQLLRWTLGRWMEFNGRDWVGFAATEAMADVLVARITTRGGGKSEE